MADAHAPWTFDPERGYILSAEGWVIATVPHGLGDETDLARGRLMAAAPAMAARIAELEGRVAILEARIEADRRQRMADLASI